MESKRHGCISSPLLQPLFWGNLCRGIAVSFWELSDTHHLLHFLWFLTIVAPSMMLVYLVRSFRHGTSFGFVIALITSWLSVKTDIRIADTSTRKTHVYWRVNLFPKLVSSRFTSAACVNGHAWCSFYHISKNFCFALCLKLCRMN